MSRKLPYRIICGVIVFIISTPADNADNDDAGTTRNLINIIPTPAFVLPDV